MTDAARVVLVVDDSAVVRRVVHEALADDGHRVIEARDGEQALAHSRLHVPDVVVLDIEMPVLDGLATLRRMQAQPGLTGVPVVLLSCRTDVEDIAEGLRLGAHDYVRKPFQGAELVARVRAAMRTRVMHQELRRRNDELERLAATDDLTGLFNRRFLTEHATRATAQLRRHGGGLGVLLLDVDSFKEINDEHGHAVGDAVLVELARRLRAAIRTEDLVGRWGGEEFLVLSPDRHPAVVRALAERLRRVVAATPFVVEDGLEIAVTCSGGWASARPGDELAAVMLHADRALYAAKAAGRNTMCGA